MGSKRRISLMLFGLVLLWGLTDGRWADAGTNSGDDALDPGDVVPIALKLRLQVLKQIEIEPLVCTELQLIDAHAPTSAFTRVAEAPPASVSGSDLLHLHMSLQE